jgi:glyoxylase I family protein
VLHHLALGARDVDALAKFYERWFGLREVARHRTGEGALRSVWLDLGGAVLMIEHTADDPRRVEGVGAGPFLLAFRIAEEGRAAFEARLAADGITIEARTAHTSYFRDPEGNRVALSCYPLPTSL